MKPLGRSPQMFRKKMLLFSSLFLPFAAVWIFQMVWMRDRDIDQYKQLIRKREIASSTAQMPANQHRKGVQKDIWFSQDGSARLHYEIFSESSLLTLTPIGNHFEIIESLEGIRCWMQDKLITDESGLNPTQQARLIEAEKGVYRHTKQEFTASDVNLSLFRLEGHSLPKAALPRNNAYLTGVAQNISFLFGGKTPKFQANQFQAAVVKE